MTDGQSIELRAGDIIIFPHGDAHHMSSGKGARRPFPDYGINAKIKSRDLSPLHAGGGGETSRFVCAYIVTGRDLFHECPHENFGYFLEFFPACGVSVGVV
jgi:hypothetical protein